MSLRISIVTGAFFPVPPAVGGAVERLWHGIACELVARGDQVTMIGRAADGLPATSTDRGLHFIRHTAYSQSGRLGRDLAVDLVYAARILTKVPESDFVIANDFWFPVLSSLFRKEKVFINVARVPKGQLRIYRGAAGFIVPSEALRRACLAEGVSDEKVFIVPNPIDVNIFSPPSSPRSFRSPCRILYAGRIHPEKGLEILINAVKELHENGEPIQCKIVGPYRQDQGGGGADYWGSLQQLAAGLPIEFCEPVFERGALADIYRWCDFFVYPSVAERGESFGVAPVEAMSTGAIPIVSQLPCFDQFMTDGVGTKFDHRSGLAAKNLSAALLTLLKSHDLSEQSRLASDVASRFSYSAAVDTLGSILKRTY